MQTKFLVRTIGEKTNELYDYKKIHKHTCMTLIHNNGTFEKKKTGTKEIPFTDFCQE